MSVTVMSSVFAAVVTPAAKKMTLLALADYADEKGGSIYPSLRTLSKKVCISRSQAQRYVRAFIDEGLLTVVANGAGGRHGDVPVYRLNLAQLRALPQWRNDPEATDSADATRSADAQDGSHRCTGRVAPMHTTGSAYATQTTIEPSVEAPKSHQRAAEHCSTAPSGSVPKVRTHRFEELTFPEASKRAVDRGRPMRPSEADARTLAEECRVSPEHVLIAWSSFELGHANDHHTRLRNWPGMFRHQLRNEQLNLWRRNAAGEPELNQAGLQARAYYVARGQHDLH